MGMKQTRYGYVGILIQNPFMYIIQCIIPHVASASIYPAKYCPLSGENCTSHRSLKLSRMTLGSMSKTGPIIVPTHETLWQLCLVGLPAGSQDSEEVFVSNEINSSS